MTHRERLTVPPSWLLLALGVVVSIGFTCFLALPPLATVLITALSAVVTGGLLALHSVRLDASAEGLRAGRSRIGWEWVAGARELDPDEVADRVRGRSDVDCWRLHRSYLDRVVRVELADPADPHPAWLLSTRHPERLVAAVNARAAAPASVPSLAAVSPEGTGPEARPAEPSSPEERPAEPLNAESGESP